MKRYDDPKVAQAYAALQDTLERMDRKIEEAAAVYYAPHLRLRISAKMQFQIEVMMQRHKLTTQAEAVRRIMAAGAKALQLDDEMAA